MERRIEAEVDQELWERGKREQEREDAAVAVSAPARAKAVAPPDPQELQREYWERLDLAYEEHEEAWSR